MKKFILHELFKLTSKNYQLKKKLKIFLGSFIVGCFLIGILVAWGGVTAFKSIVGIGTNPVVQEKIMDIENEIKNAPALFKSGCLETFKDLINIEIWLEKPIAENYNNIKSACLNK